MHDGLIRKINPKEKAKRKEKKRKTRDPKNRNQM